MPLMFYSNEIITSINATNIKVASSCLYLYLMESYSIGHDAVRGVEMQIH